MQTSSEALLERGTAAPLGVGATALAGCVYVALVDPNETTSLPPCPFLLITGLDCPGCGATRSVRALLGGDVWRAMDHNIVWVLMIPLLAYAWVAWLGRRAGYDVPWPEGLGRSPWLAWGLGAVVLGFWVVRNLWGADHYLRSGV